MFSSARRAVAPVRGEARESPPQGRLHRTSWEAAGIRRHELGGRALRLECLREVAPPTEFGNVRPDDGDPAGIEVPRPPGPMIAEANSIEEMCPSPIPLRATATRSCPSLKPLWSGWGRRGGIAQRRSLDRVFRRESTAQSDLAAAT